MKIKKITIFHSSPSNVYIINDAYFLNFLLCYFLIFMLGSNQKILAQTSNYYQPILQNTENMDSVIAEIRTNYAKDIKKLPNDYREELIETYAKRSNDLQSKLKEGHFYLDPEVHTYFQHVFQTILTSNSTIAPEGIRLFVSRYHYPNAYCMGEGTLVFNLDLMKHLENESQIAFILCHELAHQTLNHVNQAIEKRTKYLHSKELKRELKRISKSTYNRNAKMMELLKEVVFTERRHSRDHEAEADSLAMIYMSNTPYDLEQAMSCLAILDKVDETELEGSLDLKAHFDSPNFPFKDKWIKEETSLFGSFQADEDEWNKDSLKTHPDCKKRIQLLERKYGSKPKESRKTFLQSEQAFQTIASKSHFEQIANADFLKNTGESLYKALLLLKEHPDDAWLHVMVGKSLLAIHTAQKNYELSSILNQSAPWQAKGYQNLLDFLWKLRLKEIAEIAYHYLNDKSEQFGANNEFMYTLEEAKQLINN